MRKVVALAVLSLVALGSLPAFAQDKPMHTEAETKAIAKIKELGGQVMETAQNDPHLEVSYHLTEGKVTDDALLPLVELKELEMRIVLRKLHHLAAKFFDLGDGLGFSLGRIGLSPGTRQASQRRPGERTRARV